MIGALIAKRKVAAAFDALNRRDLDAFLQDWREDGRFVFPGDVPASGEFVGRPAIRRWFERLFEQVPELRFNVKSICLERQWDVAGNNVAIAHWENQAVSRNGYQYQNSGVTVITIEGGKVTSARDYVFDTGERFRRVWGVPD